MPTVVAKLLVRLNNHGKSVVQTEDQWRIIREREIYFLQKKLLISDQSLTADQSKVGLLLSLGII